jgi:hypothetical protein
VRIWQAKLFSNPTPSPSVSEVKFAQNAKPDARLELEDAKLLTELLLDKLEALDKTALDEAALDTTELEAELITELALEVIGADASLLPPPPQPTNIPAKAKHKRDLFKYI